MQFDVAYFFHRHRIAAIGIRRDWVGFTADVQSVTNSNVIPRGRFGNHVLRSRYSNGTCIQHIEEPAAQSLSASLIVEGVPGNGVDSIGQRSGVEVEEPDRSTAIREAGEQGRDVLAEIIVNRMSP